MLNVNISVVKALMQLMGVPLTTLSTVCHVSARDLNTWLNDESEDEANELDFASQLDVLKYLGVNGDHPRSDVVHYWRIHEGLFSRSSEAYAPLQVLLQNFGSAQASFITREADPALSFSAKHHFGLRFNNFLAIVEVTAHPLRNISFDPSLMPELSWVPGMMGVLLPEHELTDMGPGSLKVRTLTQYLTYTTELARWEKLRDIAMDRGLQAGQLESLLLGLEPAESSSKTAPKTTPQVISSSEVDDAKPATKQPEASPLPPRPPSVKAPRPAKRAAPRAPKPARVTVDA
jgi:hypothetical protein